MLSMNKACRWLTNPPDVETVCGSGSFFSDFFSNGRCTLHVAPGTCFLVMNYSDSHPYCQPIFWLVPNQGPKFDSSCGMCGTGQYSALTAWWLHYIHQRNVSSFCISIETVFRKVVTYSLRFYHNAYTHAFLFIQFFSCQHLLDLVTPPGVNSSISMPLDSFK